VLNIAHRGASGRFPENTLRAFRAAFEAGADICELDVRLSRDGVLVVIHDDSVDRTTNGRGAVDAMTVEELQRLDAGVRFGPEFSGEQVPKLDEVFDALGSRCGLNIELKAPGTEHHVCRMIAERELSATSLVSAFDWGALARIRHISNDIRVGLLGSRWPARLLAAATEMRADAINPRADIVTEDLCIAAHKRSINVYAWTADDPALFRKLIAYGVDGIMTNYPDRLAQLMDWR
jgi:glycerophosphoryl diester phosphodiesterase